MTNNKQQTAVEWFSVRRDVLEIEVRLGKLSPIEYAEELTKAEQQANAMHKEEITQAWKKGDGQFDKVSDKMSLEYYEQTYGGGEQ